MKITLLATVVLFTPVAFGGDPVLQSTSERTYTPRAGAGWGDINEIVLEWMLPADEERPEQRSVLVTFERHLHRERADLRYWKANVRHSSGKEGDVRRSPWFSEPRLSRDEFIAILAKSEAELSQKQTGERLIYVSVGYHCVKEHEQELARSLKQVFASTKGEVVGKHRGIMRKMYEAFASCKAIAITRERLRKQGLDFLPGRMEGDYYTPVDPELARTWKAASELQGFGLRYPPIIMFIRNEAPPDGADKPPASPGSKSKKSK